MPDNSANNKRIAKNTLFLYVRMLFLVAIGFYSTRLILEALGVEDLGIYNVIGSFIVIFDFVSSGLINSTQRYVNIGLGKGDKDLTRQYFSQSFFLHIAFALFIVLAAETVGLWFVYNKLVIPPERFHAALVVYHLSVLSLVVRFIKICFESDIIANEQMSVFAYMSIFEGVAKILICYVLLSGVFFDRLILYAVLLLAVNVAITVYNVVFCLKKYPETRVGWFHQRSVYKELLSFIGVNSFGVISWAAGKQGVNILLNLFFGPAVNGARGLAGTLDGVISRFGTNVSIAVRPQITKLYAKDEHEQMIQLAMRFTRYEFYIVLALALPVLFRTDQILGIWLKEVPDYTKVFVQILMFETLVNLLSDPFSIITTATGKIVNIQVWGRLITLSGLPIGYVMLCIYPNPYLPVIIMVVLSLCYSIYVIYDVNRKLHFGIMRYVRQVLTPIALVAVCSAFVCWGYNVLFPSAQGIIRTLADSAVFCMIGCLAAYSFGISRDERQKFQASFYKIVNKYNPLR